MNMYRFAIIGLGHISQYYITAISKNPDVSLVAFCDKNDKPEILKKYNVPFYNDYKIMLNKELLEAVVILTPNYTHYEIIGYAINKKVNVLCEKPLGLTIQECQKIITFANKENIILMTAFHRRYNKHILQLKKNLTEFSPLSISFRYFENINEHSGGEGWYFDLKKSGGGCVLDNGINIFDLLLDFIHKPIIKSSRLLYDKNGMDILAHIDLIDEVTSVNIMVDLDWVAAEEIKDMVIETREGKTIVNMLSGFPTFKQSLWHEYEGVVSAFTELLKINKFTFFDNRSLKAMELVSGAYQYATTSRGLNRLFKLRF